MTQQQKLQEVRGVIVAAVPDIMELKFGCKMRHDDGRRATVYEVAGYGQGSNCKVYTTPHHVFYSHTLNEHRIRENGSNKEEWANLGRPITLEDVLRAINKKCENTAHLYMIDDFGGFRRDKAHMQVYWSLGLPLNQQPEAVIDFLYSILIENV